MTTPRILLTGGRGRLGTELQALLVNVTAPSSLELNVTDQRNVIEIVHREQPTIIVHAAAYTDVSKAERERDDCWRVNVEGTRNVALAANEAGAKLIHISTDYVFSGEKGAYSEDDSLGPPVNYYALTKLVAEESARLARRHLIIRTSFRPREFQYPVAFSDVYTGQDYVDVIAPQVAEAITHALEISDPVLHIATERKSVFELARRRNPSVREGLRADVAVPLPADVSLDTKRWQNLRASWAGRA